MTKEKDGCAIFLRRTFLFFVGLASAKLLKEYFSITQIIGSSLPNYRSRRAIAN
jgi:hypothetical protein